MQMHKKHIALATLALAAIAHPAHAQISSPPPAEASFTVSGYAVEGDNPLGEAQTQAALAPFVGQHVGIERLQQAATALETLLRENGYGFYRVVLPPQDIGGVIRLQMFRFTVGTVEIKGNQFFSNDNILRSLPQLATGSSPNTNALARDLALANENPSKRVNVTFRQGQLDDTVDASVDVKDSRTVSAFVLLNNTGTAQTGNGRLTLGASHANLFDKDHQATFTYTTSPTEPGRVHQWGGYYRAPLYDHGAMVSGYYTTSSVSSGVVANTINVTGRGDFAGIAVSYYLAPKGDYRSYLTLGLDDKHFRNDKITTLGGAALFPNYRTRPLTLSYTGRFQKQWGQWGYNLEYAHNLSSGGGNDDAAYGANRAGASTSWNALRYGFDVAFPLPAQWLFMARLRGQDSGDALVPGEQFGIGGALSLRGLPERVLSGDSGHWGNLEFWTPALAENLRMLVFYDFGRIRRHNDATLPSASVSSFGLGVRWSMGKQLSASLDLGHVLSGRSKLPAGTSRDRAHLNVSYQF
ncbi:MAG: ShlB/FhaC/HecB family hemolysin secretion/activation protein [Burkholderiaceae bacterium]|nr:ShlB/FhaC/HecB family hemolysin secretion/activation protein [Rhodoferax sp.]MCB2003718.1 ShlB/FhaC/HecB family hemolysin secretion/activation protein [Rhodoferax sp.]MCB2030527.1 ShlB/FhaC/HecB family hemolysin secretion/activation protein [Rhodoferax sp.]MCB2040896.1 ShlB/FhaC/HecB family hemolysin secretion/activation protein [Rhodoferax sp.]MCP5260624.1 ShlB/FhaC/HecB family hemolysin secretion/activation protein [Rhodoferax sp.]